MAYNNSIKLVEVSIHFFFVCFLFFLDDFSVRPWLFWDSLCVDQGVLKLRYACLCLPSARWATTSLLD